jgi:hypothetical protein
MQVEFLKQFNTVAKVKNAVRIGKETCLEVLAGVVNHMAPAGKAAHNLALHFIV